MLILRNANCINTGLKHLNKVKNYHNCMPILREFNKSYEIIKISNKQSTFVESGHMCSLTGVKLQSLIPVKDQNQTSFTKTQNKNPVQICSLTGVKI